MGIIKDKRIEKGLTQEQLSEMVGVTNKTISSWERFKTAPNLAVNYVALSEILEVDYFDLVEEYENKNSKNR